MKAIAANVIIPRDVPIAKPSYKSSVMPVSDFHVSILFECNITIEIKTKYH